LLAFAAAQIPAFAIVIAFERIFPYQASWNRSRGDVRVDAAHLVTITVVGALLQPGINAVGAGLGAWLSGGLGLGLWPTHWPLAAQLALALAIGELFQYWVHRLEHEREFLWRFHATHHSAPRLYWLNASRFHFVDIALNNAAAFVPLVALGAGIEIFALWNLFAAIHGIFQHANLELRLGPLNWIFSMAELHRWHHSRLVEESNRNYGQNLIIWDIVFGTRYLPADRLPPVDILEADHPGQRARQRCAGVTSPACPGA
jgi:sterol desaturase/sphingolipid hydroxylase (fatty acid hydroxylase superfamily)